MDYISQIQFVANEIQKQDRQQREEIQQQYEQIEFLKQQINDLNVQIVEIQEQQRNINDQLQQYLKYYCIYEYRRIDEDKKKIYVYVGESSSQEYGKAISSRVKQHFSDACIYVRNCFSQKKQRMQQEQFKYLIDFEMNPHIEKSDILEFHNKLNNNQKMGKKELLKYVNIMLEYQILEDGREQKLGKYDIVQKENQYIKQRQQYYIENYPDYKIVMCQKHGLK